MRMTHTILATVALATALLPSRSWAHCDTMEGPIVPEAKAALARGDVTPVLKWVRADDEGEIQAVFGKAVAVRGLGAEAQELADRFFLETLVRLHRAGEGAPYTGLKDTPVAPIVAMADRSLADGSADGMIARISAHLEREIRERFERASAAKQKRESTVEAGRAYVEAYVSFVHYVEGVHDAIVARAGHHGAGAAGARGDHQH